MPCLKLSLDWCLPLHMTALTHLLLGVVVIGAGEKMPKDEFWNIDLLLFVDFDRHSISIVPYCDGIVLLKQIIDTSARPLSSKSIHSEDTENCRVGALSVCKRY